MGLVLRLGLGLGLWLAREDTGLALVDRMGMAQKDTVVRDIKLRSNPTSWTLHKHMDPTQDLQPQ